MLTTTEIRFDLPHELIQGIPNLSTYGFQSFVLQLYLDEEISFGKAAKLLGMSYDEYLAYLGKKGVPYFRDTTEEVRLALQKLEPA